MAVQKFRFGSDADAIVHQVVKDLVDHALSLYDKSASDDVRLDALVRAHVARVLKACGGNRTYAAQLLGVNRRSLQRWFTGAHRPRAAHQSNQNTGVRRRRAAARRRA